MIPVDELFGRERVVTLLGMAALVAACWGYLWTGAGTGMSALDMTAVALFPHRLAGGIGRMDPSAATVILMWWVMMIAMMTPGAVPLVLLYRACCGKAAGGGTARRGRPRACWPAISPRGSRSRSQRRRCRCCCSRPG
jgi:predicted metal-binding membrane protein